VGQRIAGIAFLKVDSDLYPLRGNFTVSPSPTERAGIAGQDYVHGFSELPRVPYIEGDFSTIQGFSLEDLITQTDVTVIAQCANQYEYVLHNATVKGGFEENTRDGQVRVRWEGLNCEEIQL